MGDAADMILEGIVCQICGEYMEEGNGIPQTCDGCSSDNYTPIFSEFSEIMESLEGLGFDVYSYTSYHFKITQKDNNKRLDLFPKKERYHDTKNNIRGDFRLDELKERVIKFFNQ